MRMRRATSDKVIITSEIEESSDGSKSNGQVIGINLGWDFIAEHEHGIDVIKHAFGVPVKPEGNIIGVDARTVTKIPSGFKFFEVTNGYSYLIFDSSISSLTYSGLTSERVDKMLEVYEEGKELETAWCKESFGIRMKNDVFGVGAMALRQIYGAFVNLDAMIFLGGDVKNNSFARLGLVLVIRSRVPEEVLSRMREADNDYLNLMAAVEKTGPIPNKKKVKVKKI